MNQSTESIVDGPVLVWVSKFGGLRLVLTSSGPVSSLEAVRDYDLKDEYDRPARPYWGLEVSAGIDLMGHRVWRSVDRYADAGHWREAFRELAAERGLFSAAGD